MKKIITFCLMVCLLNWNGRAQDTIFMKNGAEVKTKVLEIGKSEIKYKRFDNINGPTYTIKKQSVSKIKYENGVEDIFKGSIRQIEKMKHKPLSKVRYAGLVEVGQSAGSDVKNGDFAWGSSITTAHGVKINERYFVGVGIGLNVEYLGAYEGSYVALPIYATTQVDVCSNNDGRQLFVSAAVGGQVGLRSEENRIPRVDNGPDKHHANNTSGGLWANCMVGMRWGDKLYIAAGPTVRTANDTVKPGDYAAVGAMLAVGIRF